MTTLCDRILDCFPAGTYGLSVLLRLLEIVETDTVATAAVECRAQPRLLINPDFVVKWAATPEKLLMLVLHELHHVLLGHTRLFPRVTPVDNLVFDAVINALLCRMFPQPEHTSFFTDFYRDDVFPECLLRPPERWQPDRHFTLPRALRVPAPPELGHVYRALYSARGASYHDLYELLRRLLDDALEAGVRLLGSHDEEDGPGKLEETAPVLFDIVRQIVERWPQPPDPIAGRALADLLKDTRVAPRRGNRERLRGLLRRIGGADGSTGLSRAVREEPVAVLTPLPTFERRSVVLAALGAPPLLHRGTLPWRRRVPAGERVHVYLDVSGSIGNLAGALYGAVLDCAEVVHPVIHLFSTDVVEVSLEQLRRGECRTTGGTSIDCVARHVEEGHIRRAVLLTDGYVGRPRGHVAEVLRRTRLGVALTPGNSSRADLDGFAAVWAQLE
jgi:hypothetical protein